ncbi:hypothetical protein A2697_05185 [Candidatus Curtissbacteria bacterium RIFCSPHIGHO2_01_FULL_41_44]|uniref:Uncharacterized protein n=1 Tax=Candidatus Curtissbacteria bacterium RIFCSPLOWO2_01_FULL_42_50 TaxID=1797730 RepID=A0A1F5H3G4_9BACT|nr:MAG: hypothetical protein A2697_05185 [Candidatus Curtissbacteria bacterium RIFCSPHIGHO2_01_FULL_41_44]OGD93119.1 MAG: hypothetical protein A3C33_04930 [Candidatus Curtissbacteria bacterium RIFCSPHIGHO2_02_FULL_42_58]OGD96781.1 MAG: hypothetical protein A3E71_01375 [Candidatus Curtissbacteria bacterium RIFCSPHIGHO2_12_FULL_42_33]OGD98641.1 MAG: hypothetical protein A3B54_02660 [Candidatus Curtissbacteria bacterium RIFCSPLOWO2_01_FULL_42_50]OGE02598.1 MAG: hypothetical protein A3G16_03690 [Ca
MDFLKWLFSHRTWLWHKWLVIAQAIGNFQAQVILSLFYLVILLPVGLMFRFLADPLRLRWQKALRQKTNFGKWEHPKENLGEARKQY